MRSYVQIDENRSKNEKKYQNRRVGLFSWFRHFLIFFVLDHVILVIEEPFLKNN